jgi:predicted metal-dependent phosphoesterase TrpH
LISLAVEHGISVISITDHDSITAYDNITNTSDSSVMVIPAVEISTILEHSYLHMLGYHINVHSDALAEYIQKVSDEKTENTRINFENAVELGCFNYEWERVLELNKNQPRISGVHVVKAMQEDKYSISDMGLWDMFHKYFWAESSDFIPTETATAFDAIDIIKRAGGIPVIAHPKSIGNDNVVVDLIEYGALGIEVFHPIHTNVDILKYRQIADSKGIYITGGTDWHGKNNGIEVTRFGMCGLENDKYPILSITQ